MGDFFREVFDRHHAATHELLYNFLSAPAQEEKVEMGFDVRCKKCDREHNAPSWDTKYCRECAKQRTADLRQLHREAALAALPAVVAMRDSDGLKYEARVVVGITQSIADEFIRQYNPDAVIAEVVG